MHKRKINIEKELETIKRMVLSEDMPYEHVGKNYGVSGNAIKKLLMRNGVELSQRRNTNPLETFNRTTDNIHLCPQCHKSFKALTKRTIFCSKECHNQFKKDEYIRKWQQGLISGTVGYSCSHAVRNYMLQKCGNRCQRCGWGETNQYTGLVPLTIHHIDGNSLNNKENNLMVLCPNCHALTENFGSKNTNAPRGKSKYYGKGR